MPTAIHATEKPLSKIFSDDYFFSIPPYQRPYAWTVKQAEELLTDLLAFLGNDSYPITEVNPYFLGSIVLIKSEGTDSEAAIADVVDGQQRLTTLTILLSVLRKLDQSDLKIEDYLFQEANEGLDRPESYRLKLRQKDEQFFRDHIQKRTGIDGLLQLSSNQLTDSQQRIQENAHYFLSTYAKLMTK